MATCLIGLGSNLGDRAGNLRAALRSLSEHASITSVESSRFHATSPIGGPPGQDEFLNSAARVETTFMPGAFFNVLKQIETELGRERGARWAARVLDLDLLLYEREVIDSPDLQVPHPRMAFRRFVLAPAVEVAAEMIHPTIGWTVRQLLHHLETAIDYIAITGTIGAGKTGLARRVAARDNVAWIQDVADESMLQPYLCEPIDAALAIEMRLAESRSASFLQLSRASPPTISDFWFDQSLAFARTWSTGDSLLQFERQWTRLRDRVTAPKLLVFLDRASPRSQTRASELTPDQVENFLTNLQQIVAQRHHGPVLRLCEWKTAGVEVRAAIQAMR